MKICNRCGRELSEDNFYKDTAKKDGLHQICKDCHKQYCKKYHYKPENRERHKIKMKQYRNNDINKQKRNEWQKQNRKNIKVKIDHNMTALLNKCLSGEIKNSPSLQKRCGYTIEQLRQHFESQFTPEMSWDNYCKYWECDHIIPKFRFYYTSYEDEEFKKCWALSNLRPLTIKENQSRPKV